NPHSEVGMKGMPDMVRLDDVTTISSRNYAAIGNAPKANPAWSGTEQNWRAAQRGIVSMPVASATIARLSVQTISDRKLTSGPHANVRSVPNQGIVTRPA